MLHAFREADAELKIVISYRWLYDWDDQTRSGFVGVMIIRTRVNKYDY